MNSHMHKFANATQTNARLNIQINVKRMRADLGGVKGFLSKTFFLMA